MSTVDFSEPVGLASEAPDPQECIRLGMRASDVGDSGSALLWFRSAAQRAPGSGIPPMLIGAELAELGHMEDAEQAYALAVVLAPDMHMARFQLGLLQYISGRVALGLVTWEPLFALAPNEFLHHAVRGFAAAAQQQWDLARQCLAQARALNEVNPAFNRDLQGVMDRIAAIENGQPPADQLDSDGGGSAAWRLNEPLPFSAKPPLATSPLLATAATPAAPELAPLPAASPLAEAPNPSVEPDEASPDSLHVLLAGYQHSGLPH